MLSFSDVTLRRGPRALFEHATFTLYRGEKIGITGANGSGKSSLLALVLGELHTDVGRFEMPTKLAIAHVAQETDASDRSAIDFVMDGDAELREIEARIEREAQADGANLGELYARYESIGGYDARSRAGKLLHGLGFAASDADRAVREFSGGWRVRLNVAQALMCRSDLLLLDEPTNHLDLDAVIWLEGWLHEYRGTLLIISHDREFLDRIINRVVNIEHGEARAYTGNYSAFEEQRAMQLSQQQTLYERQQREIAHMMSFVERFRAQATKARQAQSRLKALERMQRIAPAHVDSQFEFSFLQPEKLPRPLLAIDDQAVGYGDRIVLDHVGLTVAPGDRIALLGRNGAGKSTLTKLLAGELSGTGGKRTEARDLRIGYFAQHQLEQLVPAESPLAHLKRLGGDTAGRAKEQMIGVNYREDQSGFLAGAMAALMSESGKIGGVYGIPVPAVVKFRNGYEQGAKYINPDIEVQGVYIDSFTDPARGAETADQLIADGVDVVFGAGGQTGSGGTLKAAEEGVYVIGVDQDEYFSTFGSGTTPGAEFLITSAMKRVDQGVYIPIEDLVNGDDSSFGTVRVLSAANDGVSFAPAHDSDVPQEVTDQVQGIFDALKAGTLVTGVDPNSGELSPSVVDLVATADLNGDGDLDFETLGAAIAAAGDLGIMDGGAYTIFAPTDDAFAALPEGTLDALLADPAGLLAILQYHVVPGAVPAEAVMGMDGAEVTTASGAPITISVTDSGVVINGSVNVTATDVYVKEGIVHVIDAVLMPEM